MLSAAQRIILLYAMTLQASKSSPIVETVPKPPYRSQTVPSIRIEKRGSGTNTTQRYVDSNGQAEKPLFKGAVLETMPSIRITLHKGRSPPASEHAALLLVETHDHKLVAVEQFRRELKRRTLELPGGFLNSGENSRTAAFREFGEETGYALGSSGQPFTQDIGTKRIACFSSDKLDIDIWALRQPLTNAAPSAPHHETNEENMKVKLFPLDANAAWVNSLEKESQFAVRNWLKWRKSAQTWDRLATVGRCIGRDEDNAPIANVDSDATNSSVHVNATNSLIRARDQLVDSGQGTTAFQRNSSNHLTGKYS